MMVVVNLIYSEVVKIYNNNQFYVQKRWKDKRKIILKRDKHLCAICKKYGKRNEATIVHHIKSLEDNPELKYKNNNLISVCQSCHNKLHPEKGKSYYKKGVPPLKNF